MLVSGGEDKVQRWEYLRVPRKRTLKVGFGKDEISDWDVQIDENSYGEQGWELVNVVTYCGPAPVIGVTTDEVWIFKRPRNDR